MTASFDEQAATFDQRTGLPETVVAQISAAIAGFLSRSPAVVLEIGAGTGDLGRTFEACGSTYLGLDSSLGMLSVFRAKSPGLILLQSDADRPWPIATAAADVVLGARVLHRLDPRHLACEAARVLAPGGVLLCGNVRRPKESIRSRLRAELHRRLEELGLEPKSSGSRRLDSALVAAGFRADGATTIATWTKVEVPSRALASWRGKAGLAGLSLPEPVKNEVLAGVESWARQTVEDLERPLEFLESFELRLFSKDLE